MGIRATIMSRSGRCGALGSLAILGLLLPLRLSGARLSSWPPDVKYELPVPFGSPAASFLEAAVRASLEGRSVDALRALRAAARLIPDSPDTIVMLAHLQCERGDAASALKSMGMALSLFERVRSSVSTALLQWWEDSWGGGACCPMPLLYPPRYIVHEEAVVVRGERVVLKRVYVVEREDGEGTVLVKQTTDETPSREAFVLNEMKFQRGEDHSGIPPPFPLVLGSFETQNFVPGREGWSACALDNIQAPSLSIVLREDPGYFDEEVACFDLLDRLLAVMHSLQGAGVTHRRITADTVLILAGDMPALVSFEHAVAQGMPFANPELPGGDGGGEEAADDMFGFGDILALGHLIRDNLPGASPKFDAVLDMMTAPVRHERITHVLSLRLLLGSCLDNRTDLVNFRDKILKARTSYTEIATNFPQSGIPHNNLGSVYFDSQMLNDALSLFLASVGLELPFRSGATCNVAAVRQMICYWQHRAEDTAAVVSVIEAGGEEVRSVRNLYAIALNLPMEQHLAVSIAGAEFAHKFAQKNGWAELRPTLTLVEGKRNPRISLAYLSSDLLTGHAVANSMRMVLTLHDEDRVSLSLFITRSDQSIAAQLDPQDAGLGRAFLVDASGMSQEDLARKINTLGVHVVVDCNGQTGKDSMAALSLRPAALQVHYLGFPSTLGASYIDHIIGDANVSPPDLAPYYTEKLLFLSHTFQVTSHRHRQGHPWQDSRTRETISRGNGVGLYPSEVHAKRFHGLSQRGPLLCNFNQHFKLDPEMFAAWARVVSRVNGSTLVLLRYPEESEPHLRRAAREVGLTGEQLSFLPKAPLPEHLARTSFCDIFVDNREYNSGTTATDALWAGAPTISLPREKHAGRHAASMLSSLGNMAGALQARSLHDYEEMAVAFLSGRKVWRKVHEALVGSRETGALWDPQVWVRDVERTLAGAWEWHVSRAGRACTDVGSRAVPGGRPKCSADFAHIVAAKL